MKRACVLFMNRSLKEHGIYNNLCGKHVLVCFNVHTLYSFYKVGTCHPCISHPYSSMDLFSTHPSCIFHPFSTIDLFFTHLSSIFHPFHLWICFFISLIDKVVLCIGCFQIVLELIMNYYDLYNRNICSSFMHDEIK